jgi:acetyl esterase
MDVADKVLPELVPLLQAAGSQPPIDFSRIAEHRPEADATAGAMLAAYVPAVELASVADHDVGVDGGTITVRSYRPSDDTLLPALVYFHGGGWAVGSVDASDAGCRRLAAVTGRVVVSVGYRLAPEHPWPTPLEDCYAAVTWTVDHADELGIDTADIAVGGGSAGGNLAAAVALACRDRGGPSLAAQWLEVPALDLTLPREGSIIEFGHGFGLDVEDIEKTVQLYVQSAEPTHPYVSPLLAPDLSGLPPAVITVAGCDPLRDQGAAYAARLEEAGVPVRFTCWDGHLHATMALTTLTESAAVYETEIVAALRELSRSASGR